MIATLARQFTQVLLMGETLSLKSTLRPGSVVHDPTLGAVPQQHLTELAALWRNRGGARDPRWVNVTSTPQQSVAELEIVVEGPIGDAPLPVAIVADHANGQLEQVRIYHSFWPIEAGHRVRGPIRECSDRGTPPGVVARYQEALARGALDEVLACFGDGAYAREPAGGPWTYRGLEGLHTFYSAILRDGGIRLRHCSVIDDGTCCAIEYVVERWGATDLTPQAGVAVYERNGNGLLAAARIYDDVEPPL